MPAETDDEDEWYERRIAGAWEPPLSSPLDQRLREPMALARRQAMAMAGVDAFEANTYRPAPEGKSVRLPFSSRPLLTPADQLTERLVGEALGPLGRYIDDQVRLSPLFRR